MAEDPKDPKTKVAILREELALAKEIERLYRNSIDLTEEQVEKAASLESKYGSLKDAVEAINDEIKNVLRTEKDRTVVLTKQLDALKAEEVLLQTTTKTIAEKLELNENQIEQQKILIQLEQEKAVHDAEALKKLKDKLKQLQNTTEELKKQQGGVTGFIDKLKTAEGRAELLNDALKKGTTIMGNQMDSLAGMISGPIISGFKDLVFQFDNVTKTFARTTGLNQEFNDSMMQSFHRGKAYGVTMEEASEAHMALVSSVNEFTMASEGERQAMADTISMLSQFGIATDDLAAGIQTSMAYFSQSMGEATETAAELKTLANELQVIPGEMAAQYASMGSELAKFGNEGVDTFKDLARIQKLTGMEMEKVLRITAKFDTFEGAAEAAGSLNAALGTNAVNAMDLLMETDPAARFEQIRNSILDAGLSFDSMSYYQKQFFAQAAGLDDVGDLALMLRGRYDLLSGGIEGSAESYEEMALRAQQMQTFQEKMQSILADNIPLFESLAVGITNFLTKLQEMPNLFEQMIAYFVAFKAGAVLFKIATALIGNGATGAGIKLGIFALAVSGLAFFLFVKQFASNFVEGLVKFGLALTALVIPLRLIQGPLRTLGPSAATAGSGMLVLGGGIALIGAGIGAAAYGVSMLVDSFVTLFTSVPVEDFVKFAAATFTLGAGALLAGAGLLLMGGGMIGLGLGLLFVSTKKLQAVGNILLGMGQISAGGESFSGVASGIKAVAKASEEIDTGALSSLQQLVDMTSSFVTFGSAINSAAAAMTNLANAMANIGGEQAELVAESLERTVEALNDVPVIKTTLLTTNYGVMGMAAAALGVTTARTGAQATAQPPPQMQATPVQNRGSQDIYVQLDGTETRRFLEGEIVRVDGTRARSSLFGNN